jgi:hypothetical protein
LSAMGNGCPDMYVHNFAGNTCFFVEAKRKYRKSNPLQVKWAENCPLPVYELHSVTEARDLIIHNKYER